MSPRTKCSCLLLALSTALVATGQAAADTIELAPVRDNTIYETPAGNLSNGAGQRLFVGRSLQASSLQRRRALLAFDIAGNLPAGAVIQSVELRLNVSKFLFAPHNATLHRTLSDWGEGPSNAAGEEGGGAQAQAGDATWLNTFFPDSLWDSAGGDFDPASSATVTISSLGFVTWGSTPEMVADVQAWLDDPASNYGWLLRGDESTAGTAKRFDSRENPVPTLRPLLTIEFTSACPCLGDLDGDLMVTFQDLVLFLDCLAVPGEGCDCGDVDGDDNVTFQDLVVFLDLLQTGACG